MIGGYDTIVVASHKPRIILPEFLKYIKDRWPILQISINGDHYLCRGVIPEEIPPKNHIHVVRDKRMMKHFNRTGGTLMSNGEGPLSLWYNEEAETGPYTITLITPADPEIDRFSGEIWGLLKKSCKPYLIESYVIRYE